MTRWSGVAFDGLMGDAPESLPPNLGGKDLSMVTGFSSRDLTGNAFGDPGDGFLAAIGGAGRDRGISTRASTGLAAGFFSVDRGEVAATFDPGFETALASGAGDGFTAEVGAAFGTGFDAGLIGETDTGFAVEPVAVFASGFEAGLTGVTNAGFAVGLGAAFAPDFDAGLIGETDAGFAAGCVAAFAPGFDAGLIGAVDAGFAEWVVATFAPGLDAEIDAALPPDFDPGLADGIIVGFAVELGSGFAAGFVTEADAGLAFACGRDRLLEFATEPFGLGCACALPFGNGTDDLLGVPFADAVFVVEPDALAVAAIGATTFFPFPPATTGFALFAFAEFGFVAFDFAWVAFCKLGFAGTVLINDFPATFVAPAFAERAGTCTTRSVFALRDTPLRGAATALRFAAGPSNSRRITSW